MIEQIWRFIKIKRDKYIYKNSDKYPKKGLIHEMGSGVHKIAGFGHEVKYFSSIPLKKLISIYQKNYCVFLDRNSDKNYPV